MGVGTSGNIDISFAVGFYCALSQAGFTVNDRLYRLHKNWVNEKKVSQDAVPAETVAETAKGKTIIETLKDMVKLPYREELPCEALTEEVLDEAKVFSDTAMIFLGRSGSEEHDLKVEDLALQEKEKQLMDTVCRNFSKVVLLLNCGNALSLGFLEDYPQIKSVLYIGFPGETGMASVAGILKGSINPSGRLVDTFYKNVSDHPAVCNTGSFKYKGMDKRRFVLYKEDIYVGYRFTETFYDEAEYDQKVMYPFGFGMSYSRFAWSDFLLENMGDHLEATVTVQNLGPHAGKDVVQIYCSAPYSGRIEKPKKVLVGFAKTNLLDVGEKQTLTLNIPKRNYASYSTELEAYLLEKGSYTFAAGENAHTCILSCRIEEAEDILYRVNDVTNVPYKNLFSDVEGSFVKLSRRNPQATMPKAPTEDEYIPPKSIQEFQKTIPVYDQGEMPVFNKDHGLKLKDMKNVSFDDPKWDLFTEQFSYREMRKMVTYGGFQTIAIKRFGIPKTECSDGPAAVHAANPRKCGVPMPSETVLACTWNPSLAYKMGNAITSEARILDVHCWYGPAMNTHRSPLGGRNFEYYSEDPLISGTMAAEEVKAARNNGLGTMIKHFAVNDQETHRAGLHTWCSEQAMREIYLKPFEFAVKQGKSLSIMSGLNCLGSKWCGESEALVTDLLHKEWGFKGCVITDGAGMSYMRATTGLCAGTDLWLLILNSSGLMYEKHIKQIYKLYPAATIKALRRAVKGICYMVANTWILSE